jgi:hypothetical protein
MASFKDSAGKEYTLRLTFRMAVVIKEKTTVDLIGDFQKAWMQIHSDVPTFCNVLFHMVKGNNQFDGDEAAFFDLLDGDTLEAARNAVVESVIDFFPNQQRTPLKEMDKKAKVVGDLIGKKARVVMDERVSRVEKQINEATGDSFGTLLEDLQSSLGHTPSAN